MSDDEGKESLNPRVEKFVGMVRRNFLVSAIIVGVLFIGATVEFIDKGVDAWKRFVQPEKPNLSIAFLDKQGPQSSLTVSPSWKDHFESGFSEIISIAVGLRNSGTAAATRVHVYLVFPPGVFRVQKSSGEETIPSVLGDLMKLSGSENVESFYIERIDPSPIANAFEKELKVALRFRVTLGIPVMEGDKIKVPAMAALSLDISSPYSTAPGEFPVLYAISFSESEKPIVGSLTIRLNQSERGFLERPNFAASMDIFRKDSPPPSLSPGKRTDAVEMHFLAGGLPALNAFCDGKAPDTIAAKVYEERNDKDAWIDIATSDGLHYVYIDRGRDGTLDQFFLPFPDGEWWEMRPTKPTPYISLANVLDNSNGNCLPADVVSKLGIKH
jgi:hypothetical protein